MIDPSRLFTDTVRLALTGKTEEAIALCVNCGDTAPILLTNLGALLNQNGNPAQAEPILRKALSLAPHLIEATVSLTATLNDLGRYEETVALATPLISDSAPSAQLLSNLGNALNGLERQQEAIPYFRQATTSMSDDAKVWTNLANTALEIGLMDEAERSFVRAIDLTPHEGALHRSLSMLHRYHAQDPHLLMMQELLPTAQNWTAENRAHFEFALGKAYDDCGDYHQAMGHYLTGNALKRQNTPYDEARAMGVMDAMEHHVSQAFTKEHGGHGNPSNLPIFIVGMPRSGTTLVEQILASLPGVAGMGELMNFQSCLTQAGPFPAEGSAAKWFDGLGGAYINSLGLVSPQLVRIVDKMPSNFIYAGLIPMALPNAKIIHLHRNPVDTCFSCFTRLFTGDQPFSYDLAELGRYYRRYQRLTDHWREILPKGVWLDVSYESLVADFESQARRLVEFIGLPWDAACLTFHKTERTVKTASAAQVRLPLYGTAVGKHHHYAPYLTPLIEALNGA